MRWESSFDPSLPSTSILCSKLEISKLKDWPLLYRPMTAHWQGQFRKLLERQRELEAAPAQVRLDGENPQPEEIGLAKLTMNIESDPEKKPRPVKAGVWLIRKVSENMTDPDTGNPAWVLALKRRVA